MLLLAFAALHCLLIYVGIGKLRLLVYATMPLQLALFVSILAWACWLAPVSESLSNSRTGLLCAMQCRQCQTCLISIAVLLPPGSGASVYAWLVAINSSTTAWSTLILNVADMSRMCPTQVRRGMIEQSHEGLTALQTCPSHPYQVRGEPMHGSLAQRDQIVGQSLGMPLPFAITGWIGILAANASRIAFGTAMWQIPGQDRADAAGGRGSP